MNVGIDIVDLNKFENRLSSNKKELMEKIFTQNEVTKSKELRNLAGIFAAKEALIKALSNKKIKMNQIEIGNDNNGKPILLKPKKIATSKRVEISIAHDGNYTVAMCLIS